jgi:hypothetical protein
MADLQKLSKGWSKYLPLRSRTMSCFFDRGRSAGAIHKATSRRGRGKRRKTKTRGVYTNPASSGLHANISHWSKKSCVLCDILED